jgi:Flp pilus assembly protein TadG
MRGKARALWKNSDGAVAPTVALSLTALIAAGGIAFDYSRMASMDTELQSAADQAALAAAAQLDGNSNACSRASAAAHAMLANRTYMANDSNASGTTVTIPDEPTCDATGQIRFYQSWDTTNDVPGPAATSDANAKVVGVTVDSREAFYALTPIVAAMRSGQMNATAYSGLDSAICKVPPLMMCNPNESNDPDFTIGSYIGKGIRLVANDGGGIYGPGNFGFLDVGNGNGAQTLRAELGSSNTPGNCVSGSTVDSETGNVITVRDALNTRFGIYDGGSLNQPCGNNGSLCPPSVNIRKDLLLTGNGNALSKLGISTGGGQPGWKESSNPYPGSANITTTGTPHSLSDAEIAAIAPMGYPEDECHAFKADGTGVCTPITGGVGSRIGDGNWDRYAYFKSNARGASPDFTAAETATPAAVNNLLQGIFGTTTPSRFQVYQWEMNHSNPRLNQQNGLTAGSVAFSRPGDLTGEPGGVTPGANTIDRRVLTVAVINCTAENVRGHTVGMEPVKFVDIFLTQPSLARSVGTRTSNSDIYVEIIGTTQNANDEGAVQLVKKSIPYLIQ